MIYTIGHSTHAAETFNRLLTESGVRTLVDVRSLPGSRRYPHFNQEKGDAMHYNDEGDRYRGGLT